MSRANPERLSDEQLSTITEQDILKLKQVIRPNLPEIPIDEILLAEARNELESLIGMDNIKKDILEVVEIVRYKRRHGENLLHKFFFHTILIGNPGTGKTTVSNSCQTVQGSWNIRKRPFSGDRPTRPDCGVCRSDSY